MSHAVLRFSAWLILALVAIGYILSIPSFAEPAAHFQASPVGRPVVNALLLLVTAAAFTLWGSAVWYAWNDERSHALPKWFILALLIFGQFVGGFFYYFLFVRRWRSVEEKERSVDSAHARRVQRLD
jgi:hypothetical protein